MPSPKCALYPNPAERIPGKNWYGIFLDLAKHSPLYTNGYLWHLTWPTWINTTVALRLDSKSVQKLQMAQNPVAWLLSGIRWSKINSISIL